MIWLRICALPAKTDMMLVTWTLILIFARIQVPTETSPHSTAHIFWSKQLWYFIFWKKAYQVQSFRSLSFLPCFFFKGLFFHAMYVHHVCRLHQFLSDPPYLPFYPTSSSVSITLTVSVFPRLKWKGTKPMNKNKIYKIKINNFVRQKTNNKKKSLIPPNTHMKLKQTTATKTQEVQFVVAFLVLVYAMPCVIQWHSVGENWYFLCWEK